MVEKFIEVFTDDFSVFGSSFDNCLENLQKVLKRYEEKNLVLNWEKCHFMATRGIVIGHIISANCIQVDKTKIDLISSYLSQNLSKAFDHFWDIRVLLELQSRLYLYFSTIVSIGSEICSFWMVGEMSSFF